MSSKCEQVARWRPGGDLLSYPDYRRLDAWRDAFGRLSIETRGRRNAALFGTARALESPLTLRCLLGALQPDDARREQRKIGLCGERWRRWIASDLADLRRGSLSLVAVSFGNWS